MFCLWEDSFDLVSEIEESISKIYTNNNLNYSSKTNRSYPTPTFGDSWVGESSSKSGRKVAKKTLSTNRITEVIDGFAEVKNTRTRQFLPRSSNTVLFSL